MSQKQKTNPITEPVTAPIPNQAKANAYALGTVLLWSTVSTAFKLALAKASVLLVLTYAMLLASLILFLYLLLKKEESLLFSLSRKAYCSCFLLSCMLFLYYNCLFIGYTGLPVQIAQPINYAWAIMLALLGCLLLKQPIKRREIFWIFFAFTGVLIISTGNSAVMKESKGLSLFCIFLSTVLYALYWIYNTKNPLPSSVKLFLGFLGAGLLGLITLLLQQKSLLLPQSALLPTCYIGLFELSIPFLLWDKAILYTKRISKIATIPLISPFLALLWAHCILDEQIRLINIIGLVCIVCGIFMQQKGKNN